jgi:hypothetical protein
LFDGKNSSFGRGSFMKIIALDIETSGLEPECSLLTAFFQIVDFNPETKALTLAKDYENGSLYLRIKHDLYHVQPQAMSVNKIDLVEHHKISEYKQTAGQKLYRFLKNWSKDGANKLVPFGQGVKGDLPKIYAQLLGRLTWEQFCSYRTLDCGVVARFYQMQGKIPMELSCGLESLVDYFCPDVISETKSGLHDAQVDTLLSIEVLRAELRI